MHFQSKPHIKISALSYMFRRLRSAIFREPKVILPKLHLVRIIYDASLCKQISDVIRYNHRSFSIHYI
jgi:hypothetical protein